MLYRGSCHCGAVRFEVEGELTGVMECNCSICRKSGFLHWIVREDQLRFTSSPDTLSSYVWGTGAARHFFCGTCGISPMRRPRMMPDDYSVNVRCLEAIDIASLNIEFCDGAALDMPGSP